MLSAIRRRIHLSPATVIAGLAMVFAITGGAYAANNVSSGPNATVAKKAKTKVLRGPRGPQGPAGKQGPAGAPGAQGLAGANGKDGAPGPEGKEGKAGKDGAPGLEGKAGKDGAPGKSVESFPITDPSKCHEQGGVALEVEESGDPHEICNGQPWTVGSLPKGATEMGTWALGNVEAESFQYISLSFSVPLAEGTLPSSVHYVNGAGNEEVEGEVVAEPAVNCHGNAENPSAPAGMVCIYQTAKSGMFLESTIREGRAGVTLGFNVTAAKAHAYGSWAVTAS